MKFFNWLTDFIFPRICVACETIQLSQEEHICIGCMASLPRTYSHLNPVELIDRKLWGKVPVKGVFSFFKFSKNSYVQNILHALKYKNKPHLAEYIGKWYAQDLKNHKLLQNAQIVIGVPMFKSKQRQRGYNQADEFAKGLSDELGIEFNNTSIVKVRGTVSQTKTKSRFGRFINTSGVFEVAYPEVVKNKSVILVDDLLTTGSTLEEAGSVLINAGCKELFIVTIAAAY